MRKVIFVPLLLACGTAGPVTRQDGPPAVLSAEAQAVRFGVPDSSCKLLGKAEGRDGYGHGGTNYQDGTLDRAQAALRTAVASLHGNQVRIDSTEMPSDKWLNGTSMVHFPYVTIKGVAFSCP